MVDVTTLRLTPLDLILHETCTKQRLHFDKDQYKKVQNIQFVKELEANKAKKARRRNCKFLIARL